MSTVVWGIEREIGAEANLTRSDDGTWNFHVDDGFQGSSIDLTKEELYGLYAAIKNELQIAGD